jgi:hypothetical protein
MTSSEKSNNEVVGDLAKSLQVTTSLMQTLLSEIQDNATTLAVLREKFDTLGDKVQSLSRLVHDDNGEKSVITKLALIEKTIDDINEDILEIKTRADADTKSLHSRISVVKDMVYKEAKTDKQFKREKMMNWFKIAVTMLPGLFAIGIVVFKYFLGVE